MKKPILVFLIILNLVLKTLRLEAPTVLLRFFGDSRHGLSPATAGIGVWLNGVGQARMYRTAEQMKGRTRLHRCREGILVNNGTRIEGVLIRIGSRGQDTKCVVIS